MQRTYLRAHLEISDCMTDFNLFSLSQVRLPSANKNHFLFASQITCSTLINIFMALTARFVST